MIYHLKCLILQSQLYQDSNCIISVFSEKGITNVFVKKGYSKYTQHRINIMPITLSEIIYEHKHNNMKILKDSSLINSYNEIKTSYENISTAGSLISAIITSQWIEKPSPLLYSLLTKFLEKIPHFKNKNLLLSTFFLKIMKHDGILDTSNTCFTCQKSINNSFYRYKGKILCQKHTHNQAIHFDKNEEIFLKTLVNCRQTKELIKLDPFEINLFSKIDLLFKQAFSKNFTK